MKNTAEVVAETEFTRIYKVEIKKRYLEELFCNVALHESNAREALGFFHERIDALGHEVNGYNNDDDYGEIALATSQGRNRFAKDREASIHASKYIESKVRQSDMEFAISALGFASEYLAWKRKEDENENNG